MLSYGGAGSNLKRALISEPSFLYSFLGAAVFVKI
jgi:hypothetical protein